MPYLFDIETRVAELTRSINHVLINDGPAGLTLRRIAKVSGVSTSSMLHHLGSREHLIRVAAGLTAKARRDDIRSRAGWEGPLALVPNTSDQVLDARAWLAWLEIWRCEPTLERWITQARAEERAMLARMLDFELTRGDLFAVMAMIDGLTVAVCAPSRPMRLEAARQALTRHLGLLGCSVEPFTGSFDPWADVTLRRRDVS